MMSIFVFCCLLVALRISRSGAASSGSATVGCDAQCRASLRPFGADSAFSSANCFLQTDTPTCHNLSLKYEFNRRCTSAELDMVISSRPWHQPSTNIESHVLLNLTMVVHERVLAAFLELECLYAPDTTDAYCHDHNRPNWDRMIWPCRLFDLRTLLDDDNVELRLPTRFNFDCFRIYGRSQYAFNVSLVPQMCRSTFIVTIPDELQVHPEMTTEPKVNWSTWSPLAIVDTNSHDGIWIRFGPPPPELIIYRVTVQLFHAVPPDDSFKSVYLDQIVLYNETTKTYANKTGVKYSNAMSGDYRLFLFVQRHDCHLLCDPKDGRCLSCPHTSLNFTLTEDHLTTEWRTWNVFTSVVKYVGFAAIGILILTAMVIVGMIFYLRHRKNIIARTVREVELRWRPKILLIYSDDCAPHSSVVAELGRFLKANANADVYLDQWALGNSVSSPNEWMLRSLETCDFYIVVLSAGTKKVFEGHSLMRRRHFPDLFHLGVTGVMQELLRECRLRPPHSSEPLRKYIWVRFDYSAADCIEPFLTRLPCTQLVLPPDLLPLISHLHSVSPNSVDRSTRLDTVDLDAAIAAMREIINADPEWLNERVSSSVDQVGLNRLTEIERSLDGLPFRPEAAPFLPTTDAFRTAKERAAAANGRYSLSEPDDDQADLLDAAPQYGLVGGPDQLSDSD